MWRATEREATIAKLADIYPRAAATAADAGVMCWSTIVDLRR
jgi:hypothetical protein